MSYMGQVSGRAMQSGDIGTDAVTTAKIADLNVTSAKVATGLDAVKIADGTVTNAELQYINSLSSNAQTQITARLPLAGGTMTGATVFGDQLASRFVAKDYGEAVSVIGGTGGGTQDFDLTNGNVFTATVDTSTNTFTFSNPSATGTSCSFTLLLTNGGSQTVNWPGAADWGAGTAPTLTAAGLDVICFTTIDAGSNWYGFLAGADIKTPS